MQAGQNKKNVSLTACSLNCIVLGQDVLSCKDVLCHVLFRPFVLHAIKTGGFESGDLPAAFVSVCVCVCSNFCLCGWE